MVELCSICARDIEGNLLKPNIKTVKWMGNPCPDCQTLMKQGFIFIGAVGDKTVDATSPYRSGNVYCVDWKVAEDLFKPNLPPKSGVAFVDVKILQEMKFPGVNINA